MSLRFGMQGMYTIKKYKAGTGELVQQIGPFDNLITDIGLDRLGVGSGISYYYVGSGSAPASVLDTQMQGFIASTNIYQTGTNNRTTSSPYWFERSEVRRFNPRGVNYTVSEVGVGWNSTSVSALFSRALVVDGVGTPTTISVLADEYLDVTYTLRVYPPLGDLNYDAVISGVTYSFSSRIASVTNTGIDFNSGMTHPAGQINCYNGASIALGDVTSSLVNIGTSGSLQGCVSVPYVANSLVRSGVSTTGLNLGNLTNGIRGLYLSTGSATGMLGFATQVVIDKYIPKDNTKSLSLNMSYSWGRYTP